MLPGLLLICVFFLKSHFTDGASLSQSIKSLGKIRECEEGWVVYRHRCYKKFMAFQMNYRNAEKFCRDAYQASITSIDDKTENDFLVNRYSRKLAGFWFKASPNATYSNWESDIDISCACTAVFRFDKNTVKWVRLNCDSPADVICEKGPNSKYQEVQNLIAQLMDVIQQEPASPYQSQAVDDFLAVSLPTCPPSTKAPLNEKSEPNEEKQEPKEEKAPNTEKPESNEEKVPTTEKPEPKEERAPVKERGELTTPEAVEPNEENTPAKEKSGLVTPEPSEEKDNQQNEISDAITTSKPKAKTTISSKIRTTEEDSDDSEMTTNKPLKPAPGNKKDAQKGSGLRGGAAPPEAPPDSAAVPPESEPSSKTTVLHAPSIGYGPDVGDNDFDFSPTGEELHSKHKDPIQQFRNSMPKKPQTPEKPKGDEENREERNPLQMSAEEKGKRESRPSRKGENEASLGMPGAAKGSGETTTTPQPGDNKYVEAADVPDPGSKPRASKRKQKKALAESSSGGDVLNSPEKKDSDDNLTPQEDSQKSQMDGNQDRKEKRSKDLEEPVLATTRTPTTGTNEIGEIGQELSADLSDSMDGKPTTEPSLREFNCNQTIWLKCSNHVTANNKVYTFAIPRFQFRGVLPNNKEARKYCAKRQGTLLNINSADENDFVADLVDSCGKKMESPWLDAFKVTSKAIYWKSTNKQMKFTKFQEPQHDSDEDKCATLFLPTKEWAEESCSERHGVVCKIARN